ncbi:MAG: hypothetical protein RMI34_01615 [Chloroherpetonaceae bacterium]|nr:hypothetical protein [Chloroherpetonaceae bacterium]
MSRIERAKEWVVEQLQRFSDAAGAHVAPQKEVYLVEFVMRNVNGRDIVEIYADTDAGITIEECAQLTRQILEEIERSAEAQEIFGENFRLEISSPGVSRPLSLLRQYRKNIGRRLQVRYASADASVQTVTGTLLAVRETEHSGAEIVLDIAQRAKRAAKSKDTGTTAEAKQTIHIPLCQIREAVVQVEL